VTAVVSAAGSVVERYMYAAYGEATILDANWDPDANNESDVANARLFQGQEYNPETGLDSCGSSGDAMLGKSGDTVPIFH
jgi:ribosomal protein S12 methylthiotransferase accessory factor YcaO